MTQINFSSSSPEIVVNYDKAVLTIAIERPSKLNALTSAMYTAMNEALLYAKNASEVSVVLFQGGENCFTAGNDLADFLEGTFDQNSPVVQFIKTLSFFDKPLVAAVSGAAVGVGTTLLMHCDLVYADSSAKFSVPFSKLGLCAEAASSLLIPAQVGYHKAAQWLLLGESFGAQEALQFGVINEIVSEDVRAYAKSKASKLASFPQGGVIATRRLMKQSMAQAVSDSLSLEMQQFARLLNAEEAKNAFRAFLNRE
ncbi:MAG: enoyl-CoA hydratase [Gammaproteobacteria bacterium CG22_combo_CG10-13_8_21_14_all_40_8]|nr:MAG: enoyl-CoA hydratase [Gammaproteobacteria bacterium CG22_combo_CG10-13_8_21_14_all_40_8]